MVTDAAAAPERPQVSLLSLFTTFLYIGTVGFGGAMSIVALMEHVIVRQRQWLEDEEFLHGVALGQILGAFSVNTANFVGYQLRGLAGALTAVVAFLLPSFFLVLGLTAAYLRWHQIPAMQSALHGLTPAIVAVILSAAWGMAKPKVMKRGGWVVTALVVLALAAAEVLHWKANPVPIIVAAALYGLLRFGRRTEGEVA